MCTGGSHLKGAPVLQFFALFYSFTTSHLRVCGLTAGSNCINDDEAKNHGKSRPTSQEGCALRRPPVEDRMGALNAKEWRNDSGYDDERAKDAKDPWRARHGCD